MNIQWFNIKRKSGPNLVIWCENCKNKPWKLCFCWIWSFLIHSDKWGDFHVVGRNQCSRVGDCRVPGIVIRSVRSPRGCPIWSFWWSSCQLAHGFRVSYGSSKPTTFAVWFRFLLSVDLVRLCELEWARPLRFRVTAGAGRVWRVRTQFLLLCF